MLPREARMRRPEDFRLVMRKGQRAGSRLLAVHALLPKGASPLFESPDGGTARPPNPPSGGPSGPREGASGSQTRVGFVVSKAVGSAVIRNRVKRRLRELMRVRLEELPEGCLLVIRAHPAAASARQADLAADLDLVLERLQKRRFGALRQA